MDALEVGYQPLTIYRDLIELWSEEGTQFIDLTERVGHSLRRSGVAHGIVQVRVLHTTAAIVVNENEPLLLGDFKAMLERLAPGNGAYAHDDPLRRLVNLEPEERRNGHAHLRALGLREIAVDYVVVDTLRVPREIFAAIWEAWRDGYVEYVAAHTPFTAGEVRAHFDDQIATLRDPEAYAAWMVPIVSAVVP